MAKGDIILSITPTRTMNKVKEMTSKWGISTSNVTFNKDEIAIASKVQTMVGYINSAKSKSGWTGTVSPAPNADTLITEIFENLYNQAESIRTYCACNCNHCACNCDYCDCDYWCGCDNSRDV